MPDLKSQFTPLVIQAPKIDHVKVDQKSLGPFRLDLHAFPGRVIVDMAVSLVLRLALMQLTSNYTAAPMRKQPIVWAKIE